MSGFPAPGLLQVALALVVPPLLPGVIGKTKALLAGRKGPPLLQLYSDLWKLLRKGAVYSRTTTWVFRAGPSVSLGALLVAAAFVPLAGSPAPVSFPGDLIAWAYLLGLARFATVLAALDTGSSFEGMGASREAAFAALAEPALFLALAVVARQTGSLTIDGMFGPALARAWEAHGPALALALAGLFVVMLAENSRLPVDDPATHLELTMIHEVMVLDHGGPDLAYILYGAALKLFLFGALLVRLLLSAGGGGWGGGAAALVLGLAGVAVLIGVVESSMARLRLVRVPQILIAACVLGAVGLLLG